jgi:AraC family transcriptional regulator
MRVRISSKDKSFSQMTNDRFIGSFLLKYVSAWRYQPTPSGNTLSKFFKSSTDYLEAVSCDAACRKSWRGLRLYKAEETSNDVVFENTSYNTLTLDLTGTRYHLTRMDGLSRERPTQPDDICLTPKGLSARFAWEIAGQSQNSIMAEFDAELFRIYCPELTSDSLLEGSLVPADYHANPALAFNIKLLAREVDPASARGTLFAETLIRLLAIELAQGSWSVNAARPYEKDETDRRIHRAIDYIAANFRSDISLLQLTEASGLSTSRLIQLFRKVTGKSPYAYVINQRINRAIQLIEASDTPLAMVALEAGFADQQHMTHAFCKNLSRTPASLRNIKTFDLDQVDQ